MHARLFKVLKNFINAYQGVFMGIIYSCPNKGNLLNKGISMI